MRLAAQQADKSRKETQLVAANAQMSKNVQSDNSNFYVNTSVAIIIRHLVSRHVPSLSFIYIETVWSNQQTRQTVGDDRWMLRWWNKKPWTRPGSGQQLQFLQVRTGEYLMCFVQRRISHGCGSGPRVDRLDWLEVFFCGVLKLKCSCKSFSFTFQRRRNSNSKAVW